MCLLNFLITPSLPESTWVFGMGSTLITLNLTFVRVLRNSNSHGGLDVPDLDGLVTMEEGVDLL